MAMNAERPVQTEEAAAEQCRRAEAIRQVLSAWLADESDYDERVWPEVKRGLEENRTSSRPLFRE